MEGVAKAENIAKMISNGKDKAAPNAEVVRAEASSIEWTSLLERVFETSGKVIHAETRLLIAHLVDTVRDEIGQAAVRAAELMVTVLAALFAFGWLSVAAVTLLHERFSWWQSEGIVGSALLIVVLGAYALITCQRRWTP
jgi:hypothetical protein